MKRLLEALAWGLVSLALVSCVGERVAGGSSTTDTGSEISLTGRVIDRDNVPVAGVAVRLSSAGFADTTDALGRYHVLGKAPVAALAGSAALDTLRFEQDEREVAAVPVTQWTADLPDVRIVQRD
ncbi:MAG TPA: hypothetical protein VHO02_07775, partial [Fibrobacteria bacterium]|nr:hypothetical protein [Fibrobacteria bacterium]